MTTKQPSIQSRLRTRISDSSVTSKGKATDLERTRNNQRRCRARRKEYIASLEDKIRELESVNVEGRTNKRLQELISENESLKRLLHSLGLRNEFLEAYISTAQVIPNISWPPPDKQHYAQANPRSSGSPALDSQQLQLLQKTANEDQANHTVGPLPDASTSGQESLDFTHMDLPVPWELFDFPAASADTGTEDVANVQNERFGQSNVDTLMTQAFSSAVTTDHISDTTTLCASAFSLVLKSNLKGYSAADLDLKLRVGYRYGATPTEGCRIDNKILLGVLAEIM